eukprot:COSAG01_NODE_57138_length_314_cov_0.720930_1_plen_60_part_10
MAIKLLFKKRIFAFRCALSGLGFALKSQVHMRFHMLAACAALGLGYIVKLDPASWLSLWS